MGHTPLGGRELARRRRRKKVGSEAPRPATAAPASGRPSLPGHLAVALLFSGSASLLHEMVWNRSWALILGAGVQASSTVLAVFMLGLGLGGRWYRELGDRLGARGRGLYVRLELALAAYGLLAMGLLQVADRIHVAAAASLLETPWLLPIRILLATAVLLPATLCMGATLPALCEDFPPGPEAESSIATAYAVNTVGAVAGVLLGAHLTIPEFGLRATTVLAAFLSVGAAGLAAWRPAGAETAPAPSRPPRGARTDRAALVLVVYAFVGFWGMALEVLFARAVLSAAGSTTHAFAAVLGAFLGGIAGGAALAGHLFPGGDLPLRSLARRLAALGVAVAASALALPSYNRIFEAFFRDGSGTSFPLLASWSLAVAFLLLPGLALGAIFPLAARCLAEVGGAGDAVGDAYFANSVAGAAGALFAYHVLARLAGIQGGVLAAAAAALLVAAWLGRRHAGAAGAETAAVLALALALPVVHATRDFRISVASYQVLVRSRARFLHQTAARVHENTLWYRDGPDATVAIVRRPTVGVQLRINGKVDASSRGADVVTQRMLGHLAFFLRDDLRDVLVIGLGSGCSTDSVLHHPVREVVTAELCPTVAEAASVGFRDAFPRAFRDPRSRILVADGRLVIRSWPRGLDLIVSEPTNVHVSGVSSLYTREFFRACRERLRPGGLLVQWLQDYDMPLEGARRVIRTMRDAFPHVAMFGFGDSLLVASDRPLVLDAARVDRVLAVPGVRDQLRPFGLHHGVRRVAQRLAILDERLGEFAGEGPLNTDDHPALEFLGAAAVFEEGRAGGDGFVLEVEDFVATGPARSPLPVTGLLAPGPDGWATFSAAGLAFRAPLELAARIDRVRPRGEDAAIDPGPADPESDGREIRRVPVAPILLGKLAGRLEVQVDSLESAGVPNDLAHHQHYLDRERRRGGAPGPVRTATISGHPVAYRVYPRMLPTASLGISTWRCPENDAFHVLQVHGPPGDPSADRLREAMEHLRCEHPAAPASPGS